MKSSLYRLKAGRPTVTDPETEEQRPATDKEMLGWGYKVVGDFGGDEIVHAAPTVAPPEGAEVLKDGQATAWEWQDLRGEDSRLADALLHATWETTDAEGNPGRGRGRIREARARGDIPDALETDLPPHAWAGDQ